MEKLQIVKAGGKVIEEKNKLEPFLDAFVALPGYKILVHGGGNKATALADKLGIESPMAEGRRITSAEMLEIVTMVYAGWINKSIVAHLQARHCNALGLCGADLNLIQAHKRPVAEIDYGFVGDVDLIQQQRVGELLRMDIVPVFSAITHDNKGQLLNTNADTIAFNLAAALSNVFEVELFYCFEKSGVLRDISDETTLIRQLSLKDFESFKSEGIIKEGMIPKLQNGFNALKKGVKSVKILKEENLHRSPFYGSELVL